MSEKCTTSCFQIVTATARVLVLQCRRCGDSYSIFFYITAVCLDLGDLKYNMIQRHTAVTDFLPRL